MPFRSPETVVELDRDAFKAVYHLIAAAERVVEAHQPERENDPGADKPNPNVDVLLNITEQAIEAMGGAMMATGDDYFLDAHNDALEEGKRAVQAQVREAERHLVRQQLKKACASVVEFVDAADAADARDRHDASDSGVKKESDDMAADGELESTNKRKRAAAKLDGLIDEKLAAVQDLRKKLRTFK